MTTTRAAGGAGTGLGGSDTDAMAMLARDVSVAYGGIEAVRAVDLEVRRGETVALLGPSGSGKTTLLYAMAGFLPLSSGTIAIAGELVATATWSQPPERRPVGVVFQHYGLWPHLDALATVAYPLDRAGIGHTEARAQARALLDQMRIGGLTARRPAELSGGEQQRVGLARALARRPALYLLDEPTAHLDTALKAELQAELSERMRGDDAAAIHATHDVEEALAVADRVVLLREGSVVQVDRPTAIYEQPVDGWAARLTGPAAFVDGPLTPDSRVDGHVASSEDGPFLVRPDWVSFGGPLEATVVDVRYRGSHTDYGLQTAIGRLTLRHAGPPRHTTGDETSCRVERAWRVPGHR